MGLLTIWDYLMIVLVLGVSTGIGLFYGLKDGMHSTKRSYLLADSSMSILPVTFSITATIFSAINYLGIPQESYQYGIGFLFSRISHLCCTPLNAYLFLPVFYKMRLTSVYEYLERRFGYSARLFVSVLFSVEILLVTAVAIFAPVMALVTVSGFSKLSGVLLIGLVCTFYSTMGGMRAVLITDLFQSLLIIAGIYSVIIVSMLKGHSIQEVWQSADESGRIYWVPMSPDPTIRHSFWTFLIGGTMLFLSGQSVNQLQVQRLMAVKNLKSAQVALWWNVVIHTSIVIPSIFGGLVMYNFYKDCDPVLEGRIQRREQLMPLFVIDTMSAYPGLLGLFMAGIFSACLSTVSSCINGLSAVTFEDFIGAFYEKVLKRPLASDSSWICKIAALFFGIASMVLALNADTVKGILELSIVIQGVAEGPILGVFVIGLFTVKANQRGVLIGIICGVIFSFWVAFGKKPPPDMLPFSDVGCDDEFNSSRAGISSSSSSTEMPPEEVEYFYLFKLSYIWLSFLGFLVTIVLGYVFSVFLERLNLANNDIIYQDEARKRINFDLFSPPISAKLRRQAAARNIKERDFENEQILKNFD